VGERKIGEKLESMNLTASFRAASLAEFERFKEWCDYGKLVFEWNVFPVAETGEIDVEIAVVEGAGFMLLKASHFAHKSDNMVCDTWFLGPLIENPKAGANRDRAAAVVKAAIDRARSA
jgi:hypothetical protein